MRRSTVFSLVGTGAVLIILAVALGRVGMDLDQVRIDREDLQDEIAELQQEIEALTEGQRVLQQQADEQRQTIEAQRQTIAQSGIELKRLRSVHDNHEVASPSVEAEGATP